MGVVVAADVVVVAVVAAAVVVAVVVAAAVVVVAPFFIIWRLKVGASDIFISQKQVFFIFMGASVFSLRLFGHRARARARFYLSLTLNEYKWPPLLLPLPGLDLQSAGTPKKFDFGEAFAAVVVDVVAEVVVVVDVVVIDDAFHRKWFFFKNSQPCDNQINLASKFMLIFGLN